MFTDFRFYEDQADDARETDEGTLLPLWKFIFEKVLATICSKQLLFSVQAGSDSTVLEPDLQ